MYFGIHTLAPICLGHYIGMKFLSIVYQERGIVKQYKVQDTFATFLTLVLIYPFTMMQMKMMCEIA